MEPSSVSQERAAWLKTDSQHEPHKKELREQVAWALFNKAVALGTVGRTQDSLATYDDLLRRYAGLRGAATGALVRPGWMKGTKTAEPTDPDVREPVAWALFNKGVTLGGLGRTQETLSAYSELLSRFSDSREPDVQEQVSRAVMNMGVLEATLQEQVARAPSTQGTTLGTLGSAQDPSGFFDQAVKPVQHSITTERPADSVSALMGRGVALGNTQEAIAVYDELIARFGNVKEMNVRRYVAAAMVNQGEALENLGGKQEAMEVYDAIIRSFGDATEPALREQVGRALLKKETLEAVPTQPVAPEPIAPEPVTPEPVTPEPVPHQPVEEEGETLGTLGLKQEKLSPGEYATETDLPHEAALALVAKGVALGTPQEAIEVYDEVISRFGAATEPTVSGAVAEAMVHKAGALGTLGLTKDAIAVCDEVISRFGQPQQEVLREQVAEAVAKKETLEAIARELEGEQEKRATQEQAEKETQEAEERRKEEERAAKEAREAEEKRKAQEQAEKEAQEAEEKRKAQEQTEREAEEKRKAEELVAKEAEEQRKAQEKAEGEAQRREPQELIEKGVALGTLGRAEETLIVCDEVVERFQDAPELVLQEQVAKALVNKGVALGTLGRLEETIEVCDEVLKRHQEAQEVELQEQVALALVNKGVALGSLKRIKEAIAIYTEVIHRFEGEMLLQGQVIRAKELREALQKPNKSDPKKSR